MVRGHMWDRHAAEERTGGKPGDSCNTWAGKEGEMPGYKEWCTVRDSRPDLVCAVGKEPSPMVLQSVHPIWTNPLQGTAIFAPSAG